MGTADLVPGVSGGTVALVSGIYRDLVGGIRSGVRSAVSLGRLDLVATRQHLRDVPWGLLLPLGVGLLAAVALLSGVIESLLEHHPVEMAGLFFGLVLGSVVVALPMVPVWDARRLLAGGLSAAVTFVVLGFRTGAGADPSWWFLFAAGAIAICAMILPGISGSFLLLTLGVYEYVLGAVNDRDAAVVGVFFAGCVVGLACFSNVLHWALDRWADTVMAVLIGLMVGSLRALWPWPDGTGEEQLGAPVDPIVAPVVLAVIGFAVVVGFTRVAARIEARVTASEPVAGAGPDQNSRSSVDSIPRSSS